MRTLTSITGPLAAAMVLCATPFGLLRADGGETSFAFLQVPTGVRQVGMGGAGVALGDDLMATQLNPAAAARLWRQEVSFTYSDWLEDTSFHSATYALPTGRMGTFVGAFQGLNYGDIEGFNSTGARTKDLEAGDTVGQITYGFQVRPQVWAGVTGKYLREKLDTESASAFAGDVGIQMMPFSRTSLAPTQLGLAIRNVGSKPKFDSDSGELPRSLQLGLAVQPYFKGLTIAGDATQNKADGTTLQFGIEYLAKDIVSVRGGYNTAYEVGRGFSLGFGLRAWDIQIDYAFAGFSELGDTHHVGLSFRFGSIAERHYDKGMNYMRQGDYARAIMEFSRVLQKDPAHRRALLRMKEANDQLQGELKELQP